MSTTNNSLNLNSSNPLSPSEGGTGINNGSNTLTIGANSTINQDVSTAGSPVFSSLQSKSFVYVYDNNTQGQLVLIDQKNDNAGSNISLLKSRNSTVGSHTIVQNGDTLGTIGFQADNGTSFGIRSYITSFVSGAVSAPIIPTSLEFVTTNTAGALTIGMTLDQDQNLTLNNSSSSLNVGNLSLSGNTLSSTNTNGNIDITPNGTGISVFSSDITINGVIAGFGTGNIASNTVFGIGIFQSANTGFENVAFGTDCLHINTTGSSNTAIGFQAMLSNTTGSQNIAIGLQALADQNSSNNNVAIGLLSMTHAICNNCIGIGYGALSESTSDGNVAVGFQSLTSATGANNTAIGLQSGNGLVTGNSNTFIGNFTNSNDNSAIGTIALGSGAISTKATGTTSITNSSGISIGSSSFPVGVRGDGTIFPSTTGAGFWQPNINGTAYMIPLFAAGSTGFGALTATSISTAPAASQTSALAIGTAFQNTLGYDVVLTVYLSVTAATTASILLGVGSTVTPTQQTIISGLTLAALNIIPVTIYLPNNYYALLSTSGTITLTISGQQIMPV